MTTAQKYAANRSLFRDLLLQYRHLYQTSETDGQGPRVPHPGDVLYWVGCIGAISALLFFAIR